MKSMGPKFLQDVHLQYFIHFRATVKPCKEEPSFQEISLLLVLKLNRVKIFSLVLNFVDYLVLTVNTHIIPTEN